MMVCLFMAMLSCGGRNAAADYLGKWQNTENEVAKIEIRDEGGQYFVKLLNTRGGDIEFPATFNEGTKQLDFRFSGFMGNGEAKSYLKGDTLHVNAEGRTQQFVRLKE